MSFMWKNAEIIAHAPTYTATHLIIYSFGFIYVITPDMMNIE